MYRQFNKFLYIVKTEYNFFIDVNDSVNITQSIYK